MYTRSGGLEQSAGAGSQKDYGGGYGGYGGYQQVQMYRVCIKCVRYAFVFCNQKLFNYLLSPALIKYSSINL